MILSSADFVFKFIFFEKKFEEHKQSVEQFGSRSGPTFCRASSGSKLFAMVIYADAIVAASKEQLQ